MAAPQARKVGKSWISRSRAWISILLLAPVAVMVAFSAERVRAQSWGALGFELLGWLLFLSGATYRWWATLYIGGRKSKQLVCEGAYSTCRNALYFGTFLMVLAIASFTQSVLFTLAVLAVSAFYLSISVPREERRLLKRHGQAFVEYRERVPAFFPRFRTYHSPDSVDLRVDGLHAEFLRSLRWFCLPFLCRLLMHVRAEPWWPHWFRIF